jgi:hypothetical protein
MRTRNTWLSLSTSERDALGNACLANDKALRKSGHLLAMTGLHRSHTATTVRVYNGQVSIIDGPVAETKEQIIRKFTINARDLNEAIQVATTMPQARGGPIEVRPILAVRPTRSAPFTGGHAPKGLKLIDAQTFSTGVVHLIYAPAEPA